jgi:hypothetical protein
LFAEFRDETNRAAKALIAAGSSPAITSASG